MEGRRNFVGRIQTKLWPKRSSSKSPSIPSSPVSSAPSTPPFSRPVSPPRSSDRSISRSSSDLPLNPVPPHGFSGFPAPFDHRDLCAIFSSWDGNGTVAARRDRALKDGFRFGFNRRQCLLLERVLTNVDHSLKDLRETFRVFFSEGVSASSSPRVSEMFRAFSAEGVSAPSSPRRSDSKSLADVKRDLAEIVRLQRAGRRLLEDCAHSVCSARAIKMLDDTKAFEAIFQGMDLWWQDLWAMLEQILSDYGAQPVLFSGGGRNLPGFSGTFWKYFLDMAASKDREESFCELQEKLREYSQLPRQDWDALSPRDLYDFNRARLLSLKLKFRSSITSLYVHTFDLQPGKHLGSGTYGDVYEVTWCGEKYAMKTFRNANSYLFQQEALLHAGLQHPHIVKMICHSRNEADQTSSLVMELMDENLSSFIARARISPHSNRAPFKPFVAVRILLQVAEAMEYLHREDIMHRDLKAENVLVDHKGSANPFVQGDFQVKVADFGMAKSKASSSELKTAEVGTSYWRAPEVFSTVDKAQLTTKYTYKADVYSFAFTCYEVVTGKVPFYDYYYYHPHNNGNGGGGGGGGGGGLGSLYDKIKKGERPSIPDFVHPPLASLIRDCWHKDPRVRPSFESVCTSLQKCLIDVSSYEWV